MTVPDFATLNKLTQTYLDTICPLYSGLRQRGRQQLKMLKHVALTTTTPQASFDNWTLTLRPVGPTPPRYPSLLHHQMPTALEMLTPAKFSAMLYLSHPAPVNSSAL